MMSFRNLRRARKGMSTVFGGLFFVLLILLGFNLMVWGLGQYDSYSTTIATMNRFDLDRMYENIVPVSPGVIGNTCSPSTCFDIRVHNMGSSAVTVVRVYVKNLGSTTPCDAGDKVCWIDIGASSSDCGSPGGSCRLSNTNIRPGEVKDVRVSGINLSSGSYQVSLVSARGRIYSFHFPWP